MPRYWSKLSVKLKIQFLFSELWYPLFGMTMLMGVLIPILAVATGLPWVTAVFTEFLLHSLPVVLSIISIVWYLKIKHLLKPESSPVLSFEAVLFQLVRWPWALYGSFMGVVSSIGGKSTEFSDSQRQRGPRSFGVETLFSLRFTLTNFPYSRACYA